MVDDLAEHMNEIQRALGRVEGKLEAQGAATTELARTLADIKAAMQSSEIDQVKALADIDDRLQGVEADLRKAAPALAEINVWKERGRGALMMWSVLASIFGATVATFWTKLVSLISGGNP